MNNIYIPFVFFLSLLIIVYKKRGIDVSFGMLCIYALSSFLSILLYSNKGNEGLVNYSNFQITFVPTVLYCILNALIIYPFYKFNSNRVRDIKITNQSQVRFINKVVWLYLIIFILLVLIFYKEIIIRLTMANMNEFRTMYYQNEMNSITYGMSLPIKCLSYFCMFVGGCSYFLIPFLFYSLCFLNNTKIFNISIIIGSLSPVIIGVLNMDRSNTFYWFLFSILGYLFFKPYMDEKVKRQVYKFFVFFMSLIGIYFISLTIARFSDQTSGASGGLMDYAGQSFLNFCQIWNNLDYNHFYWGRVLPVADMLFIHSSSTKETMQEIYRNFGVETNVFFSYVGLFLVDFGRWAALFAPIVIFTVLKKITTKYSRSSEMSISIILILFILAVIPQGGIISYFYISVPRTINFWLFVYIANKLAKLNN